MRKSKVTMLDITSTRMLGQFGFLAQVFAFMAILSILGAHPAVFPVRSSYEQCAAHWATCGEGRNADAQGAPVRIWMVQASAVVQMAQNRLTRRLVDMLRSVNSRSGEMMKALQPIQLIELEATTVCPGRAVL